MVAFPQSQKPFISQQEYWEQEEKSPDKHEYFDGEMFLMAGGSFNHGLLIANILTSLGTRLRGRACIPVNGDVRIKIEATDLQTYPDATVVCPPLQFDENNPHTLLNPVVIFEVLSPSTERYDRTGKRDHYIQIPSLQSYVLISQERILVEHLARREDGWLLRLFNQRTDVLELPEIGVSVPLEEIYERLELPSGLVLVSSA